jgi:hypothetical protein
MGLDTYLDLEVKRKGSKEFNSFSIIYFRKCYSITHKLEDILTLEGVKNESNSWFEYPLSNSNITLTLLKALIEEETAARKSLISSFNENEDDDEEEFYYDSIWDEYDYPIIISNEINSLINFYRWQKEFNYTPEYAKWYDKNDDVEIEEYDWSTARIVFCASW